MVNKLIAIGIAAAALGIITSYALLEWSRGNIATADIKSEELFTAEVTSQIFEGKKENANKGRFSFVASETKESESKSVVKIVEVPPGPSFCPFNSLGARTPATVRMNEIAWMGNSAGGADAEWIELYNTGDTEINLSGWQVIDLREQIQIAFTRRDSIPPQDFFLLERDSDDTVKTLTADFIYTGSLANEDEGLRLFTANCTLADEALASPKWPAGDNGEKKTMERRSDGLAWQTSYVTEGTPKAKNSEPPPPPPPPPPPVSGIEEGEEIEEVPEPGSVVSNVSHIVISEFQTSGGAGQTTDDFIELYNPLSTPFNLKGHRLVKRSANATKDTSIKSWTADTFIPAHGFYLWANSEFTSLGTVPDTTTTASIADDNGIALREGPADTGTIVDSIAWGTASNGFGEGVLLPNANPNESFERKAWDVACIDPAGEKGNGCDTEDNTNDFMVVTVPNPQNTGSNPEP
ncbi:MAG: lamin tail domain-containing protein [Patescibacteria group bacterium]